MRYEIVRTHAGWTVRLISHGKVILSSGGQVYTRQRAARRAIEIAARGAFWHVDGEWLPYVQTIEGPIEVRVIDERGER